jgi:hypothetical protein
VNATEKPLRLKIRFVSRDLVLSGRATCTIASRVNSSTSKKLSHNLTLKFEILSVSPSSVVATNVINTSNHFYMIVDALQSLLPHSYLVIIVNGLDEHHDKAPHQSILRLLIHSSYNAIFN